MSEIPELNDLDRMMFHNIHAYSDYLADLQNYLDSETIILGGDILEHSEEDGYSHTTLNWYYNGNDYKQSYKTALDFLRTLRPLSEKTALYIEYVIKRGLY